MSAALFDVVVPTVGRQSLQHLVDVLEAQRLPGRLFVVDDRAAPTSPLPVAGRVEVRSGGGAGPAHARNVGWRSCRAPWVVFLDDDVLPGADWVERLTEDLAGAAGDVAAVQGRVHVPLPPDRPATDWERNVAGLEASRWITADMAVRRSALEQVGGFDGRFPRAYREDADLALRLLAHGHRLELGGREVSHPVGAAPWTISLRKQRGNADDALMRRIHGSGWRVRAEAPRGGLRRHGAVVASALVGAALVAARRRGAATVPLALWAGGTIDLARRRIAPGPRTPSEVLAMAATSVPLPFLAVGHRLAGEVRARRLAPLAGPAPVAVLFDRDGTLVEDVPYNGDPARVQPVPGAAEALRRLRAAGCRIGLVSNQSGVGRGLLTRGQVDAVNARVDELIGPFDAVLVCPHVPEDACECRKPRPGLVLKAAAELGVPVDGCAVVGDIGSDVGAALAAGARAVLVPDGATRRREVLAARARPGGRVAVADDLQGAVDLLVGKRP